MNIDKTLKTLLNDPTVMIETFLLNGSYTITGNDYAMLSCVFSAAMDAHKDTGSVQAAKAVSRVAFQMFKSVRPAVKDGRIDCNHFDIRFDADDMMLVGRLLTDFKGAMEMAIDSDDTEDIANGKITLAGVDSLLKLFEPAINLSERICSMIQD